MMGAWKSIGIVVEGEPIDIGGINPWEHPWSEEGLVELPHPTYPNQLHNMRVVQVKFGGKEIEFAVGELSAGVYGFYVHA